ncbi:hypothetical protein BU26DRAFT_513020 [Trematosphaeria pertusa]|uniref:Uncharacterized protein n=1 Tax=Trematosphaeria pertusa TaxID=390896 RepID=A0A6A6J0B7_9PLEO|nr:uncharacterized protein BU26DRAFT_513020 [Trematosphaeria pertusa]KAF2256164.1 hypothetical protein BU26DRAFT_513020 [Trematosphaeria pertusa]
MRLSTAPIMALIAVAYSVPTDTGGDLIPREAAMHIENGGTIAPRTCCNFNNCRASILENVLFLQRLTLTTEFQLGQRKLPEALGSILRRRRGQYSLLRKYIYRSLLGRLMERGAQG